VDDKDNNLQAPLISPADTEYIDALMEKDRRNEEVPDYGILSRIKKAGGNHHFILSGIHQYGTWIVADYLRKILCDSPPTHVHGLESKLRKVFEGEDDFTAIVSGRYSPRTF